MTGRRLIVNSIVSLIAGAGFYFFALLYAMQFRVAWIWAIATFLALPVAIWVGTTVVGSTRAMIKDGVINWQSTCQEFAGPRNIKFLVIYLPMLAGFSLQGISLYFVFSGVERAHAVTTGSPDTTSLALLAAATIVLSIGSTFVVVVHAMELIWCLTFEKQNGHKLYSISKART